MANMDRRSVLLLLSCVTLINDTRATDVPGDCANVRQYFEDPATHIFHQCTLVCNYRRPRESPVDCRELCPGLFDCLVRTTTSKHRARNPFKILPQTTKASSVQSRLFTVEDTLKPRPEKHWVLYILSGTSVFLGTMTAALVAIVVWRICRKSHRRNSLYSDKNTLTTCTEDGTEAAHWLSEDAISRAVVKVSDVN